MSSISLVENIVLSSGQSSVTFSSIPQDGTDLIIYASTRPSSDATSAMLARFNSNTTGYNAVYLYAAQTFGLGQGRETGYSGAWFGHPANTDNVANAFSVNSAHISNYAATATKSWLASASPTGSTTVYQFLLGGWTSNTAPITSLTILNQGGQSFIAGSTFSLYKLTSGTTANINVSQN